MTFHMMRKLNRLIQSSLMLLLLLLLQPIYAQVTEPPNPARLVVDRTATLNDSQIQRLETKLVDYNDTTSTQIAVVLLADLNGYEPADLAFRIGEQWGVGSKGFNNGIVILIKPKTERARGQAFIAVGYGLEGIIPDAIAKRIVEKEMIPNFQQGNYYGGIDAATDVIIDLASGAYTAERYDNVDFLAVIIPLVIFVIIFLLIRFGNKSNHIGGSRSSNLPFWIALMLANQSGSSSSGSWGSFSGGSSGFGGGGFGGFGGGSFGGGGAGGSW
jgi:uncharacterized protein